MSMTADQVAAYRQNGFHYPLDVFSADQAARYIAHLESIEAVHGPMHYRVKPYLVMQSAWEIATHPRLLDAVEAVMGPDILLWDSSYIIKEPHTGSFVSWHQDLKYWGLEMPDDDSLVSVWVALSAANQANGAMRFVRGSHRRGVYTHEDTFEADNLLHRGQVIPDTFVPEDIDAMSLLPGQASLHHGWTVHSSGANTSDSRRVGIVFNYLTPAVKQVVGAGESATLVRGNDRYGHFRPEPPCGNDFAEENTAFQLEVEHLKHEVYDNA